MAIRAAGEHKQRISIHVTIDGLRLRDEKTGDSLYHHPVHKISFIAQDMTDSRAFGYIFGSPDSGHRFFGIKTDKAASQVVLAMRDLFQVVFELKKKEIELARQTIQTKAVLGGISGNGHHGMDKAKERIEHKLTALKAANLTDETSFMASASGSACAGGSSGNHNSSQMGDLVDLEQELSSIQRGISQMEKITPNELMPNKQEHDDPFGDSFASSSPNTTTPFNILPPPPDSSKGTSSRQQTKNQQPQAQIVALDRKENDWSPPLLPPPGSARSKPVIDLDRPSTNSPNPNAADWLSDEAAMNSLFDNGRSEIEDLEREFVNGRSSTGPGPHSQDDSGKFADAFIDLDPLGTGKNKPYVDKKFFFQDVKNPPKKVLKELSSSDVNFMATFQGIDQEPANELNSSGESATLGQRQRKASSEDEQPQQQHLYSEQSMFLPQQQHLNYFEPFEDPFDLVPKVDQQQPPPPSQRPKEERRPSMNNNSTSTPTSLSVPLKVILPPETNRSHSRGSTPRNRSPNLARERGSGGDSRKSSYDSTRRVRQSPVDYSGFDAAPEPPPRPDMGHYTDPPPLPPKKAFPDCTPRASSNRPSLSSYKKTMSPREPSSTKSVADAPPLPLPSRRVTHSDSRYPGPERPQKLEEDGYLVPSEVPVLLPPPKGSGSTKRAQKRGSGQREPVPLQENCSTTTHTTVEGTEAITDITLSQLLQLSMDELADKLNVSVQKLSTMTIVELTKYLSEFLSKEMDGGATAASQPKAPLREGQKSEQNVFKVSFDDDKDATFVAVFDDNFGEEMNSGKHDEFVADFDNANIQMASNESQLQRKETNADRYAVFREIFDEELKSDSVPDLLYGEEDVGPVEAIYAAEENARKMEDVTRQPGKIDTSITATISQAKDRYAALRDIVLVENLFEAAPVRTTTPAGNRSVTPTPTLDNDDLEQVPTFVTEDMEDNFVSNSFVSDNFGDFDEHKSMASPLQFINVESPEQERPASFEIKDKSVTPTFVSARDDLEIDELMNLAVSNLSLNNINSLSPQTTQLQLKNASTSPILRAQQCSPLAQAAAPKANVIDTSTSPIIMSKMLSPVAFGRSSPRAISPTVSTITAVVTTSLTIDEEQDEEVKQTVEPDTKIISQDNCVSPSSTNEEGR